MNGRVKHLPLPITSSNIIAAPSLNLSSLYFKSSNSTTINYTYPSFASPRAHVCLSVFLFVSIGGVSPGCYGVFFVFLALVRCTKSDRKRSGEPRLGAIAFFGGPATRTMLLQSCTPGRSLCCRITSLFAPSCRSRCVALCQYAVDVCCVLLLLVTSMLLMYWYAIGQPTVRRTLLIVDNSRV